MSRIVRRAVGTTLSQEALREIEQLAAMPDCEIDTSDIPEWTEEQFAAARIRREVRAHEQSTELQKKAS